MQTLEIKKYGSFKPLGKNKAKKQIILCHTSREVEEYLTSLNFRYNGNFDKIPNYVVTREGTVLELLPENTYSNFFYLDKVRKNSIIICLENLGWLNRKPLTNSYINWKGSIYKGEVHEKKWRDFFFWHPYTEIQLSNTAQLCSQLSEIFQIEKRCTGHNTKFEGIENFVGITSRSNYDTSFTDLNPSFNFELFTKYFENEQFAQ